MGFFQQRYVKRHAIYHKPDIHNEIRLFAAPKIRPPSGLQFWGLDSDRILELPRNRIPLQVNMVKFQQRYVKSHTVFYKSR